MMICAIIITPTLIIYMLTSMKKLALTGAVLLLGLISCQKNIQEDPINCIDCDQPVDPPPPPPPPPPPDPTIQYLSFRGIRPDDPNGRDPIDNPERGFRFEFIMRASNLTNPYFGADYSSGFSNILQSEDANYGNNKIRLAQVYFYLTDYLQGNYISPAAYSNIQYIFDQLKASGVKALLRFAYRYND